MYFLEYYTSAECQKNNKSIIRGFYTRKERDDYSVKTKWSNSYTGTNTFDILGYPKT